MIWSVMILAAGLALTLAGMVITFIFMPPSMTITPSLDEGSWDNTPEEKARVAAIEKKLEWSSLGVVFLVSGTALQFIGTIWQVIRLACTR
jgi:hypothetical protein